MAGQGGRRPGAGRPKGSKDRFPKGKSTAERADRAAKLAAKVTAPLGVGLRMPATAPTEAPEGISPRDLLLATMRMAWEAAHAKSQEADALERVLESTEDPDQREALVARIAAIKIDAGRHVALAQQAAKDVAPYEHPRLSSVDANVTGGLVVEVKQYTVPKEKKA